MKLFKKANGWLCTWCLSYYEDKEEAKECCPYEKERGGE